MPIHNRYTAVARFAAMLGLALAFVCPPLFAQTFGSTSQGSGSSFSNGGLGSSTSGSGGFGSNFGNGSNSNNGSSSSNYGDSSSSVRNPDYKTRRDQTRNRNKKDSGTKNPAQSGVRGTAKSNVTKRKAPTAAKSGEGKSGEPLPALKVPEKFSENALYFQPAFAQVQPGDLLQTKMMLYNVKKAAADRLDLWLKYDPAVLEPQWVEMKPLQNHISTPLNVRVWRADGYIHVAGKLATPLIDSVNPLPIIHWKAIGAVGSTAITYEGPGEEPSRAEPAVWAGSENLLKRTNLGQLPLAQFSIGITPPETTEPGLRMIQEVRETLPAPVIAGPERVRLAINTNGDPVGVGETSLADVDLINPQGVGIDTVRFRILFDPSVVEVLDADADNYITDGTNIFDGDFHKAMPFDQHFLNHVNSDTGVIEYSVACGTEPHALPTGPVARIVYRVLKPQAGTAFRFEMVDPVTRARATDVSAMGRSLLGEDEQIARAALHGAYLPLAAGPAGRS